MYSIHRKVSAVRVSQATSKEIAMEYTKKQVQARAAMVRYEYNHGLLSTTEAALYESLPNWKWVLAMSFTDARALAQEQHFIKQRDFHNWPKPEGMPYNPHERYVKLGWVDWEDFLGINKKVSLSFTQARELARAQQFSSKTEFRRWDKPEGMPSNPDRKYKDSGWLGYADFLGTTSMSFTAARTLTHAQHFSNNVEFKQWDKPKGMPGDPSSKYKDSGWVNWGDFLGNGNAYRGTFLSFTKARALARTQHFTGEVEFKNWKRPEGMPSDPSKYYKDSGWRGMKNFIGTEYLSFTKARTLARAQHFKTMREFDVWNKPVGMPRIPDSLYKHTGWVNWYDFLGKKERKTK